MPMTMCSKPSNGTSRKTARRHDWHTLLLLRSIHGVGQILALVMLYEIHDINRFESVQDFASYCRLVKCSSRIGRQEEGNRRRQDRQCSSEVGFFRSGHAFHPLQSPGQEAGGEAGQDAWQGESAFGILAHKLARAIYYMLKNNAPFDLEKFMATA